ncbi:MAG: AAA family ATPase, partial [Candidatus Heimdallarchaeota archaeon]
MVFLKRLILEGFKSYGSRRIELPLSHGFNAVIGPNGSGKSNIVDAIVFVLGGLSTKTMRAASLSDLIFAGSSEEKPSRRTRVELVLDNTDQQIPVNTEEIRISREVRNSGSSVYRFNGVVSTRKELIDLLAFANLGSYNRNIVLQGEIAQLASMTPHERRALVESVAGIAVFDEKKAESERELEQTRTRYREIDLLLGNIRETRNRLAQEKEEAEKYVNLQREIEKKTVLMLSAKETQLEAKIAQLRQSSELHRNQRSSLQKKRTKLNLEKINLDKQLISLDQVYSNLQEQKLSQLFSLSDKKRAEKIEFEAKATFEQEKIIQFQKEHKKLERKVKELKETRKELTQRDIALTNGISEVLHQLEEKNATILKLRKGLETLDKTLEHDREQARHLAKKIDEKRQQKIECESRRKFLHSICESNKHLLNE